jgi:hypothetical protein
MGWSWYGPSTWDQGVYTGANNQEDDLEIITNDAVGIQMDLAIALTTMDLTLVLQLPLPMEC